MQGTHRTRHDKVGEETIVYNETRMRQVVIFSKGMRRGGDEG
jgi:hypothetical protein